MRNDYFILLLLALAIVCAIIFETKKTTKAFEQRELERIIKETYKL